MHDIYILDTKVGEVRFVKESEGELRARVVEDTSVVDLYLYKDEDVYRLDIVMDGTYLGSLDRSSLDEAFDQVIAWEVDPEYNI